MVPVLDGPTKLSSRIEVSLASRRAMLAASDEGALEGRMIRMRGWSPNHVRDG
jgi:hypothetical protein